MINNFEEGKNILLYSVCKRNSSLSLLASILCLTHRLDEVHLRVVCAFANNVITYLHARLALLFVELEVGVDQTRLLLLSGWVGLRWWPWFLCKK